MKIELLEKLKTVRMHEARALRPHVQLANTVEAMGPHTDLSRQYRFETKAEFLLNQWAGEGAAEHVHKVAVDAIARSVYGDVVEHLRDTLDELYQDGMHDHVATKRLNELVAALTLR